MVLMLGVTQFELLPHFFNKKRKISLKAWALKKIVIILLIDL